MPWDKMLVLSVYDYMVKASSYSKAVYVSYRSVAPIAITHLLQYNALVICKL